MTDFTRDQVIGQELVGILQSPYGAPLSIREGLDPVRFRKNYLRLSNRNIVEFDAGGFSLVPFASGAAPGETTGISADKLFGITITAVVRDDCYAPLILLRGGIFIQVQPDCDGTPLFAGWLTMHYDANELAAFVDYWTEQRVAVPF